VGELGHGAFARLFRFAAKKIALKVISKDASEVTRMMTIKGAMDLPLRSLFAMSDGLVSYDMCVGLIDMLNGKTFKGLCALIKGFRNKPISKKEIYK
ncbi:MAG: hypothetical protein WC292_08050, partial [Clostridia bacterium]